MAFNLKQRHNQVQKCSLFSKDRSERFYLINKDDQLGVRSLVLYKLQNSNSYVGIRSLILYKLQNSNSYVQLYLR